MDNKTRKFLEGCIKDGTVQPDIIRIIEKQILKKNVLGMKSYSVDGNGVCLSEDYTIGNSGRYPDGTKAADVIKEMATADTGTEIHIQIPDYVVSLNASFFYTIIELNHCGYKEIHLNGGRNVVKAYTTGCYELDELIVNIDNPVGKAEIESAVYADDDVFDINDGFGMLEDMQHIGSIIDKNKMLKDIAMELESSSFDILGITESELKDRQIVHVDEKGADVINAVTIGEILADTGVWMYVPFSEYTHEGSSGSILTHKTVKLKVYAGYMDETTEAFIDVACGVYRKGEGRFNGKDTCIYGGVLRVKELKEKIADKSLNEKLKGVLNSYYNTRLIKDHMIDIDTVSFNVDRHIEYGYIQKDYKERLNKYYSKTQMLGGSIITRDGRLILRDPDRIVRELSTIDSNGIIHIRIPYEASTVDESFLAGVSEVLDSDEKRAVIEGGENVVDCADMMHKIKRIRLVINIDNAIGNQRLHRSMFVDGRYSLRTESKSLTDNNALVIGWLAKNGDIESIICNPKALYRKAADGIKKCAACREKDWHRSEKIGSRNGTKRDMEACVTDGEHALKKAEAVLKITSMQLKWSGAEFTGYYAPLDLREDNYMVAYSSTGKDWWFTLKHRVGESYYEKMIQAIETYKKANVKALYKVCEAETKLLAEYDAEYEGGIHRSISCMRNVGINIYAADSCGEAVLFGNIEYRQETGSYMRMHKLFKGEIISLKKLAEIIDNGTASRELGRVVYDVIEDRKGCDETKG